VRVHDIEDCLVGGAIQIAAAAVDNAPADGGPGVGDRRRKEPREPGGVGEAVVVDEREEAASCRPRTRIARFGRSPVLREPYPLDLCGARRRLWVG